MKTINLILLLTVLSFGSLGQTQWMKYSGNPLLRPGSSMEWDKGIGYFGSVVYYNNEYHMWYAGYTVFSNSFGHATSQDGIDWTKDPNNPVFEFGPQGSWDCTDILCSDVSLINGMLHMWYTGYGGSWSHSAVGHAVSLDNGVTWIRDPHNPVMTIKPEENWNYDWIRAEEVVYIDSIYHMWYSGGSGAYLQSGREVCIGHATSLNGLDWTRDTLNPVLKPGKTGDWDYPEVGFPSVIFDGSKFHMWYSGGKGDRQTRHHDIGYATSSDGSNWIKHDQNPILIKGNSDSWDGIYITPCAVIDSAGVKYKMWYQGRNASWKGCGYAYSIEQGPDEYIALDKTKKEDFAIYPNPANDFITIETDIPGKYNIDITSVNGQLVSNKLMVGTYYQLKLTYFQAGVYIITVRSKDDVKTKKIVKH